MQPKTLLSAIICLLFVITATAQTGRQPFEDLGKKVKVLTLTNGKYEEFFDDDSIQQIGSALININTMQLVKLKLTPQEQKQFDNSSTSRFLSVDPLAKSFPMLTPYQYASNSPIANVDLDGGESKYYSVELFKTISGKGTLVQSTSKTTEEKSKAAGWFVNGKVYQFPGKLGEGTLYTITTSKTVLKDNGTQEVVIQNIGAIYVPPPPKPDPDRPVSSLSIGIQIFGSGFDPSDNTGDKPNPKATIFSFNLKEFQEIIEPILLGLDVKNPADLEVPTIDELVEHAGDYELSKKIDKLNEKWEEHKRNAPTFCRTCNNTYEKKNDTVTYNPTDASAEDTIEVHGDEHKN